MAASQSSFDSISWESFRYQILLQRIDNYGDSLLLTNGPVSLRKASNCGVYIPWKWRRNKLTAFCRAQGKIDDESPHFYLYTVSKSVKSVLSHWLRIHNVSSCDIKELVLSYYRQKKPLMNFTSNGSFVYYHWIDRVRRYANSAERRRQRQCLFFSELKSYLIAEDEDYSTSFELEWDEWSKDDHLDSIYEFDEVVAVTFEYKLTRDDHKRLWNDWWAKGCASTMVFTLFSNGYYRYNKRECIIHNHEYINGHDSAWNSTIELKLRRGIWDYKGDRIIMEGMCLKDERDLQCNVEDENEDLEIDEEWSSEDKCHETKGYPGYGSKPGYWWPLIQEAFGDILFDDKAVWISPREKMEGVTNYFDFFRKEMIIENPSKVIVHLNPL